MSDDRNERERGGGHEGQRRDGPAGAEFLHLEVSRWLESGARGEADAIVRDLLRNAVRERLEERLGERLRAVGAAIADQIADDLEANLAIEAAIDTRRESHRETVRRVQVLFREPMNAKAEPRTGKKKR